MFLNLCIRIIINLVQPKTKIMKKLTLLLLLLPFIANAQQIFQKEITHNEHRFLIGDIERLSDNSYLACGNIVVYPQDSNLAVVIKLDSLMHVIWCKRFKALSEDRFTCLTPLNDGNFLVGGTIKADFSTYWECSLYKIDASGNVIWNKIYSTTCDDFTLDVFEQTDHSIVLFTRTGDSGQPTKILKTDGDGNLLSEFTIYNDNSTIGVLGSCVTGSASGNYFLSGTVYNPNLDRDNFFIAKTSDNALIWYNEYDFGRDAYVRGITDLGDGNIAVTGNIASAANFNSINVMKVDENTGSVIWAKEITQVVYSNENGDSIFGLDDSRLMLCGRMAAEGFKAYATELDADGSVIWAKQYGSGTYSYFRFGIEVPGDRFLFVGSNQLGGETYLVQTNSDGSSPCFTDAFNFLSIDLMVDIYSPPRTIGDPDVEQLSLPFEEFPISLSEEIFCSGTVEIEETHVLTQYNIYPNPADKFITIESTEGLPSNCSFEIINNQGKIVYQAQLHHQKEVIETPFLPGLYFIAIKNSKQAILYSRKLIVR